MGNVSIKKLHESMATAKRQALTNPYAMERTSEGLPETAKPLNNSGKRTFPETVRANVQLIFDKYPDQLRTLGLYYDGGFTAEEIADMDGRTRANVTTTLKRAKDRLKKYLTPVEYDSIRWFIGDHKTLEATQPRFVNPLYNDFVEEQPVRRGYFDGEIYFWDDGELESPKYQPTPVQSFQFTHPAPKDLPVPRHILIAEREVSVNA